MNDDEKEVPGARPAIKIHDHEQPLPKVDTHQCTRAQLPAEAVQLGHLALVLIREAHLDLGKCD
jgi:hypothetical protein